MDNKLSELSKPVATVDVQRGRMDGNTFAVAWSSAGHALPDGPHFIYSQEYVSALLAELEAKDKRITELEAKLATPVRLTDERTLWAGEDDYDTGHVKGWNANRIEQAALLKKQGFTVEGDE